MSRDRPLRTRHRCAAALLLLTAAAPATDPDWPCEQPLVPTLTAATLWTGPLPQRDWHADAAITTLVAHVADRRAKNLDGVAQLEHFVAAKPSDEARAELFAGLVDQTNIDRTESIYRLRQIAQTLRTVTDAAHQLETIPADTPPAQRTELTDRRALLLHQQDDLAHAARDACEVPVDFEHRLSQFGRILQP